MRDGRHDRKGITGMQMNTIGIRRNLDRKRIRKLLIFGVAGSIVTGIGDFLLGFGEEAPSQGSGLAEGLMANAVNMSDAQLIAGGLLGAFGLFLEGLAMFAVYRLMADASPKYAHIYRSGIFGYIWTAPVACHMNVGLMNIAYRYILSYDPASAAKVAKIMIYGFCAPMWAMLLLFWIPAVVVQFKAFAKGLTPYPKKAKWFSVPVGMWPALLLSVIAGPGSAIGGGIGTTFLNLGNLFMFGGLLATLPGQERFDEFERNLERITSNQRQK